MEVRENYFLPLRRKILLITFLLALVPFSISLYLYYSNHESLALPIFAFSGFIILVMAMLTIQYLFRRVEAIYQQKTLLNEQFIQSNKLAALGEMAAGIAHELNEPLNGIQLFAQNALTDLRRNQNPPKLAEENLLFIIDLVKKASTIIGQLRTFARKSDEKKQTLDVHTLIEGLIRFLESQLKLANIQVELKLESTNPQILGNPLRLEQVFLNMIQNAIYAMEKTETKKLTIQTHLSQDAVNIEIIDTGAGIPSELKERIFDPFFTTRDVGVGTGLGLSISHSIIKEHKGSVEVESEVGKGTTFRIYLPLYHKEAL
ncbi:MAG: GHKL domain-containing protein [Nitrospira sp.]|nr:GHKL domain-containing protein [Nitrospira sp.]